MGIEGVRDPPSYHTQRGDLRPETEKGANVTVKEMIKSLNRCNPDLQVVLATYDAEDKLICCGTVDSVLEHTVLPFMADEARVFIAGEAFKEDLLT